ncbi:MULTISPECIES: PLP-dependent aminotransferase family protein [unclassified Pseudoalteromonas]|uniref:aminotransferase-like domain-containing protein n=1 Tax=unclassified Pseudoalteromonas TaxID=194690 RepID=UPI002097EA1A|nr:PLP-dependent aminotransferase family protein [Pseudoalteromonas sp. XMcav2-N]MCO7189014.1 PLP-dependent aminotransferase family protein [Pseudoalteromonas sp. XMcav2-N]
MGKQAKYKTLAGQFITAIEAGEYEFDQPLPSLRQLSALYQVSMTTALACYRYLESLGYITADPKRGFFPCFNPQHTSAIEYAQFNAKACTLPIPPPSRVRSGFATAQLDPTLIDSQQLRASLARTMRSDHTLFNYGDPLGEQAFRQALSEHLKTQGFIIHAQELVITQGCLDAVKTALELVTKEQDIVAVPSPCYTGLLDILSVMGRQVLEIPSNQDGIDLVQLEHAMARHQVAACLISANFQNPTGHSLSTQQKAALANMASQYRIPIIEDDVYRELCHTGTTPLPIKHFDQDGWVIWCSSISKTLAPGLRLGWCAPGRFHQKYSDLIRIRSLGCNRPLQLTLADYISRGHYARYLKKLNSKLASQCNQYIQLLTRLLPDKVKVNRPHGGLVLWFELPGVDTKQLQKRLKEEQIYILCGDAFSTTTHYHNYIRLNFGQCIRAEIETQLTKFAQAAARLQRQKSVKSESKTGTKLV